MEENILQWFNDDYPQELLKIKDAPDPIYAKGNTKLLNNPQGIIGIVGSRNCSEYGRKYAREFAKEISKSGITVISGLALGIDTSAHLGALEGRGNTIAVIATGLDKVTPEENLWLYNKILYKGGAIISEKESGELLGQNSYQKRNRIISGIADCILIVEAKKNSGSLITARLAKQQGKEVYFLPNRINEKNCSGLDFLIENEAKMVTKPRILINKIREQRIPQKDEVPLVIDSIKEEYREIYIILNSPKSAEEISYNLDKEMCEINTKLTIMELEGLITKDEHGKFMRV